VKKKGGREGGREGGRDLKHKTSLASAESNVGALRCWCCLCMYVCMYVACMLHVCVHVRLQVNKYACMYVLVQNCCLFKATTSPAPSPKV